MSSSVILASQPLGPPPWPTRDPFLFCVHHVDNYPKGNDSLGPAASLAGRNIGMDFEGKDGWRMYHGDVVPGFPQHPHRGFETVTVMRDGYIDHSDSLGATARFGRGDVQWLTAGKGIVHCEMFPLLDPNGPNRAELFQIWLNLPARSKMCEPYFSMFWEPDIPRQRFTDAGGKGTLVTLYAGALDKTEAPPPPPDSWASAADADIAIWSIALDPGATWTLPPARGRGTLRTLYFFVGRSVEIGGQMFSRPSLVEVAADQSVEIRAGADKTELLLLQGRPIGEPVAQYGPFVMNTRQELEQAFMDYRRTEFGGWPYPSAGPVFPRNRGRFAQHADGRVEEAPAG
jgi:redox-sensitive bicupin YhaK (pirin superfamily)